MKYPDGVLRKWKKEIEKEYEPSKDQITIWMQTGTSNIMNDKGECRRYNR